MSKSILNKLPKSTAELQITIPWEEIEAVFKNIFERVAKETEIAGFRKGKAPKKLIEEKINRKKIYEEVVKEIIPKAYQKSISEHNLIPVSTPKIELTKAKEGEEWVIKAIVALKPVINLKNYKEKIREMKNNKTKIWTPQNKDKEKEEKKPAVDDLVAVLLEEAEAELSDILIDEETNRLLSQLLDQTQKLGLTVEQYLMSKGKTSEQLRQEYTSQASKNLKTQFILAEVADKENITVTDEDLNKFIGGLEKPEDKERFKKDSYYIAYLLRQQKTLDFIKNL